MRTAEQWLNELPFSVPAQRAWVRNVQSDALRHAAVLCESIRPQIPDLIGPLRGMGQSEAITACGNVLSREAERLEKL